MAHKTPAMARTTLCTAALVATFGASAPIFAADDGSSLVDEIVVTAQKREQNLQDVAVSVSAFTGDQIKELNYTDAIDVIGQIPGITVARPGAGAINVFTIRGVTQNDWGPNQEAPVAVYVDEAYISQNYVSNFSLYDLERVEVLRGPQGTLYGRNATGGLVQYVTRRPSQEAEAYVEAQVGSKGRRRVEAAAGGGFSDTISGRLSGVWNENDGLMENAIGPDGQAADDWSARGQLLIEPSQDLSVLIKGQHSQDDSLRGNWYHAAVADGEFAPAPATDFFGYRDADDDPWTGAWDFDGFVEAEITQATVKVNWQRDKVGLTYVGDYQDIQHDYGEDSDVSPNQVFHYTQSSDTQQWSQELRADWEGDRTRVVAGVYFLNIDGDYGHDSQVYGQEDVDWSDVFFGIPEPGGYRLVSDFVQDTKTWAVFGQTEFELTDTLTLEAGARWTQDKKDYSFQQAWLGAEGLYVFFEGAAPGDVPYFDFTDSFNEGDWSGKVQLSYRPNEDLLWYGSINRGIKSGGFNSPVDASGLLATNVDEQFIPFDQDNAAMVYDGEVLHAVEVGFKSTWLDGKARLNASAFYYDYSDYQISNFVGVTQTVFNSDGTLWGGEVEIASSPIDGLDILLGMALVDSEADLPAGIRPDGGTTSESVLAPKWTLNGLVRYGWPVFGEGELALQADFYWKDDQIFNLSNTAVSSEDAYGVVNMSVNYTSPSDTFYASVFAKNVFDEEYREYGFDLSSGFGSCECGPGPERWFGITAGYRWQ